MIVMPAASAPLRTDDRLFSFRERFALLRALFRNEISARRIILSPLERLLPKPNYTFSTLSALRERCGQKPVVVVGADQAQKLGNWHRSAELIDEYEFLIFARAGSVPANIPNLRARFVEDFVEDISATALRTELAALPAGERFERALAWGNPA